MVWAIGAVAVIIAVCVIVVPYILKGKINRALHELKGYTGQIARLQIYLLAGKIHLYDVKMQDAPEAETDIHIDVQIPTITCTWRWPALLRRKLDLHIVIDDPVLSISDHSSATPETDVPNKKPFSLSDSLSAVMSFALNSEIQNGTITYSKVTGKPFTIVVNRVQVSIVNFTNQLAQEDPCLIEVDSVLYDGTAGASVKLYPMEPTLTFDSQVEVKSINLVLLNDLFRSFAKIDLNNGTLELYAEVAVSNNHYHGYIKPILKDLDFIGAEDRNDSFFRKVWERIVAAGIMMLQNNREDQIATRIPIEGRLDDPKFNLAATFAGVLRNAFLKPLQPSFENVVGPNGLLKVAGKKFLRNLFGGTKTKSTSS